MQPGVAAPVGSAASGDSTVPRLVIVMRHAKMAQSASPGLFADLRALEPSSARELAEIGQALAETLGRVPDNYETLVVRHEVTDPAKLSAEALVRAYTRAQSEDWSDAPTCDGAEPVRKEWRSPAPYAPTKTVTVWLSRTVRKDLMAPSSADGNRTAFVLVGHDPAMTWLVGRLLHRDSLQGRLLHYFNPPVPSLASAELIACQTTSDAPTPEQRRFAVWSLSPTDSKTEEALRGKVKSKMDTAKVFAGVLTAVTTFAANNLPGGSRVDRALAIGGLALLGLAVVLYLITMFWYDSLLLPKRFW